MALFDYKAWLKAHPPTTDEPTEAEIQDMATTLLRDMRQRHPTCKWVKGTDMRCAWCVRADDTLRMTSLRRAS